MPYPKNAIQNAADVLEARAAARKALAAWAWECLNLRRSGLDHPSVRCLDRDATPAPRRKAA